MRVLLVFSTERADGLKVHLMFHGHISNGLLRRHIKHLLLLEWNNVEHYI